MLQMVINLNQLEDQDLNHGWTGVPDH
jgi:hypothetical protein